MIKGRTVVMNAPREPLEIREHEIPGLEPGAIVVRITQAGICGSDLLLMETAGDRLPFHRMVSNHYPLEDVTKAVNESDWHTTGHTDVMRSVLVP